ncbi:ATP-dependent nuclease [Myroides marinus]|uniref:ATP-dependent nuclease n=1 Tax=Myroides marinus TaxID=703342 RepID=UPI00257851A5|nr:AAA family ATPase [Myroides marinus]
MRIKSVNIKRFRSIMSLKLNIEDLNEIVTICGANNSGKTNVLRAIEIFFKPNKYNPQYDAPNHKFFGSRGQSVYPEIIIEFSDNNKKYLFKKVFDLNGLKSISGTLDGNSLTEEKINNFLNKYTFFYIPSININFPELVNDLIEEIYDLEYEKTRFTGLKAELKKAFDSYMGGTIDVLNNLAQDINPTFQEFNQNWEVGFEFPSDVKKFRDLISNDIEFYFNDKTNRNIDAKGSGLQRLGYILMHSKLIEKITNKSIILLIDEPDIYLHNGLQLKLKKHLKELSQKSQVFITTHSKVFIDGYNLKNIFLLDIVIDPAILYKRTNKNFHQVNTILIDLDESLGSLKIKEYLGIETDEYDLLKDFNLLVEGNCDKKFLEELAKYYSLQIPNIISANGVNNIESFLDFYNSFYFKHSYKPTIKVLLDNDNAGRDTYKEIQKKCENLFYKDIDVLLEFTPTYKGELPDYDKVKRNLIHDNHEIEDFVFPEIICKLCNSILKKKSMNSILQKSLLTKLNSQVFKSKGILYAVEILKNDKNLDNGHTIVFDSINMKKSLVESFQIEGNKSMIKILNECDEKYPEYKNLLEKVLTKNIT